jgi:S1-C subfamily serine protease
MAHMRELSLSSFSHQLADIVERAAPSVVQVQGRRRLASGVVFGDGLVLTTAHALGSEDGLRVRAHDGRATDVDVRGWDPATGLVVLKAESLGLPAIAAAQAPARVGHFVCAIGRSWSGALTASSGIVSIVGGPLPTGRGRSIDRVIRTTAPMHSGYVGGAVLDADGGVLGIAAASEIRGMRIVIPADIAWRVAGALAEHGTPKRGYLGVAGQSARVPARQTGSEPGTSGVVVVDVAQGSPAESGGILVGDVIVAFDDKAVRSPMDILELLEERRAGRNVRVGLIRGGVSQQISVTIGERSPA